MTQAIGIVGVLALGYLAVRGQLRIGRFLRRRGMRQVRDGIEHLSNGCIAYLVAGLALLAVLGLVAVLLGT